ncbi:MAG TPA: DUF2723 domain-containing protein, partial [Thermoanaerobaculia bacterium]|nr:DUF2723 domain-containing protein [Thermoanaerobaculia bacterium]
MSSAAPAPKNRQALVPVGVGVTVAAVAAFCRAPGLLYADSGELLTAVARKGVAHPPGFPLYIFLGGLFLDATRFLGGSDASRLNLFSSLSGGVAAGAAAFAALLLFRRTKVALPAGIVALFAALAGFLVGFSPTLFDFSLGIEVYALHMAFVATTVALAVAAGGEPDAGRRRRLTLLSGVFAGGALAIHHATIVVALPGVALLLWGDEDRRSRTRRAGLFALGLVPGLLSYVVLPLRAARWPALNWGNPSNLYRFFTHVTAKDYQVNIESNLSTILEHAARFVEAYRAEFTVVGLLLAAFGAVAFFKKGAFAGAALALLVAGDVAFAVRYEIAEDQAAYYLPTFLATSLLLVLGLSALVSRLLSVNRRLAVGLATAAAAALLAFAGLNALSRAERRHDGRADESARDLLAALPPGALGFTPEWNLAAPAMALQDVEHVREDAIVLDLLLLRRGWYLDSFRHRYPERYAEVKDAFDAYRTKLADWEEGRPFVADELTRLYETFTRRLAEEAWKRGMDVVWFGTVMSSHLPKGAALVPTGLGYRILPSAVEAARPVEDAPLFLRA